MGLVAQTGLAQSVAGLGAGTVNATQFTQDTGSDNLNVSPSEIRASGNVPAATLEGAAAAAAKQNAGLRLPLHCTVGRSDVTLLAIIGHQLARPTAMQVCKAGIRMTVPFPLLHAPLQAPAAAIHTI